MGEQQKYQKLRSEMTGPLDQKKGRQEVNNEGNKGKQRKNQPTMGGQLLEKYQKLRSEGDITGLQIIRKRDKCQTKERTKEKIDSKGNK